MIILIFWQWWLRITLSYSISLISSIHQSINQSFLIVQIDWQHPISSQESFSFNSIHHYIYKNQVIYYSNLEYFFFCIYRWIWIIFIDSKKRKKTKHQIKFFFSIEITMTRCCCMHIWSKCFFCCSSIFLIKFHWLHHSIWKRIGFFSL